jgi:hypothetical protein
MKQEEKDFSIIIIPDTQNVSTFHPEKLKKMTQWIVDHAESLNLKMILHLGDVVNNGAEREEQYQNHKEAFDLIDGANVPMIIAIGNHDYDNLVNENRSSEMFNKYCGLQRCQDQPWFGGFFEQGKAENMYAKLEYGGRKYLFLSLEFGPRNEVLDWASAVLDHHHDHDAIIITHSYMYLYGDRTKPGDNHNPKSYKGAHGANDGEEVWQKCLKRHKNVTAVYSGHHITDHVSFRYDRGDQNNIVFQSFQNWQCAENGGDGRIRILRFRLKDNMVDHQVMNPQTGIYETNGGYEVSHPCKMEQDIQQEWLSITYPYRD